VKDSFDAQKEEHFILSVAMSGFFTIVRKFNTLRKTSN
jgi:hypothetical protein